MCAICGLGVSHMGFWTTDAGDLGGYVNGLYDGFLADFDMRPLTVGVAPPSGEPVVAGPSPSMVQQITFLNGIAPGGAVAATSYWTWSGDYPATYANTRAAKWGGGAAGTGGGVIEYYFDAASNWTHVEKIQIMTAMAMWQSIANITFTEAAGVGQAELTFRRGNSEGAYSTKITSGPAVVGSTTIPTIQSAQIVLSTNEPGVGPLDMDLTTYGGYVWNTLVHEIGHALGLGHAGPYNGSVVPFVQQYSAYDMRLWSTMSYIDPEYRDTGAYYAEYPVTNTQWGTTDAGYYRVPVTFMPLDVLAIQALYGAPTNPYLSGGQIYGFNSNIFSDMRLFYSFSADSRPVVTLWNAGVGNTLDLSGFTSDSTVNLSSGTFSSVAGLVNNLGIAANTVIETAIGGAGWDRLNGSFANNTLRGGQGNDTLSGLTGDDRLVGDQGNDSLSGGDGDDWVYGSEGDDTLDGGVGIDTVSYETASDAVTISLALTTPQAIGGGLGSDAFRGVEILIGSTFNDSLTGDTAANTLFGHDGADILDGGGGDDTLIGGAGADSLVGGAGFNTLSYADLNGADSVLVFLDLGWSVVGFQRDYFTSIQNVLGSSNSDSLQGNFQNNRLTGDAGDDHLVGFGGNDTLDGGAGVDRISYTTATADLVIDLALGTQTGGGQGSDQLISIEIVYSGDYNDTIAGNEAANVLAGQGGNDSLSGRDGDDILSLGLGNDTLDGGAGIDTVDFGDGGATDGMTINLGMTDSQTIGGGRGVDILRGFERAFGAGFDDTLTGSTGNDTLAGIGGADSLDGGAGADAALYEWEPRVGFLIHSTGVGGVIHTTVSDMDLTNTDHGTDSLVRIETLVFGGQAMGLYGIQQNHLAGMDAGRFDDILIRSASTGQIGFVDMTGQAAGEQGVVRAVTSALPAGWTAVGSGDLDGDGRAEAIVQSPTGGLFYVNTATGSAVWGTISANLPSEWRVVGLGDMTLDGTLDVVIRSSVSGAIMYAEMDGTGFSGWGNVFNMGTAWRATGVGDYDRDGDSDVLVQEIATGTTYFVQMQNGAFAGWGLVTGGPGAQWVAKETADLNADGYFDVVFENTTTDQIWYVNMAGGVNSGWGTFVRAVGWDVVGSGDYDNDGYADVLVQNAANGNLFYIDVDNGVMAGWGNVKNGIGTDWVAV